MPFKTEFCEGRSTAWRLFGVTPDGPVIRSLSRGVRSEPVRAIMIDISVLYSGLETPSTPHRYGRAITQIDPPEHQRMAVAKSAKERRPIVVWNLTRTCNLKCAHCYTDSAAVHYPDELETARCKEVLDDLAEFKVPAVLFS